jgi:4-oxalocrotonate tautomerase family enzyme
MPTVIIYWSPGRTDEQKSAVIHEITEALVKHGSARREDVLIIFQNIQPGDAGRGGVVLSLPTLKTTSDGSNAKPPG